MFPGRWKQIINVYTCLPLHLHLLILCRFAVKPPLISVIHHVGAASNRRLSVAELRWNTEMCEFLSGICEKANYASDSWCDFKCFGKIKSFKELAWIMNSMRRFDNTHNVKLSSKCSKWPFPLIYAKIQKLISIRAHITHHITSINRSSSYFFWQWRSSKTSQKWVFISSDSWLSHMVNVWQADKIIFDSLCSLERKHLL